MSVLDWTRGEPGLIFRRCPTCGHARYLDSAACPRCSTPGGTVHQAQGAGTVHAVTILHRAPSEEWRPFIPYALALVDLDEGVRVMGHADVGVSIGDRVKATFPTVGGRMVPRFVPASGP